MNYFYDAVYNLSDDPEKRVLKSIQQLKTTMNNNEKVRAGEITLKMWKDDVDKNVTIILMSLRLLKRHLAGDKQQIQGMKSLIMCIKTTEELLTKIHMDRPQLDVLRNIVTVIQTYFPASAEVAEGSTMQKVNMELNQLLTRAQEIREEIGEQLKASAANYRLESTDGKMNGAEVNMGVRPR